MYLDGRLDKLPAWTVSDDFVSFSLIFTFLVLSRDYHLSFLYF